jgi:membrane protein DedA with SNARE-associated domain
MDDAILSQWLMQYAGLVLFALLALGILALPVPEESLMVLTGVLISKESLDPITTLMAAYGGSICGISMSYLVGTTVGRYFLNRYSHHKWVSRHLEKVRYWFDRFGKWALLIGYFIPGVRHFTGLLSGSMNMPFRQFALFAYVGAVLWVSLFVSLGYFLNSYCFSLVEEWDLDNWFTLGILPFIALVYVGYSKWKKA